MEDQLVAGSSKHARTLWWLGMSGYHPEYAPGTSAGPDEGTVTSPPLDPLISLLSSRPMAGLNPGTLAGPAVSSSRPTGTLRPQRKSGTNRKLKSSKKLITVLYHPLTTVTDITRIRVKIPPKDSGSSSVRLGRTLDLPLDLEFFDFFDRICANLDVQLRGTKLGYRLGPKGKTFYPLSNEKQYKMAIKDYVAKVNVTRSNGSRANVTFEIMQFVSAIAYLLDSWLNPLFSG